MQAPAAAMGAMGAAAWQISLEWSEEEQRTLEEHLQRFPPERFDALQRYVKLAAMLPRKSVRDVALRCRWTINQHMLKKRKLAEAGKGAPVGLAAKKPAAGAAVGAKPPLMPMPLPVATAGAPLPGSMPPPFLPPGSQPAQPGTPVEPGGMIVDGPIAQLLEANYGILNTFRANMAAFKVAENTQLLCSFRDNILSIINHMENMGGVMDQMPQLPVRLNVDLANNFLPSRPPFPTPSYGGGGANGSMPPQPAVNIPGMVPLNGLAPGANSSAPAPAQQAQQPAAAPAAPATGVPYSSVPVSVPAAVPMQPMPGAAPGGAGLMAAPQAAPTTATMPISTQPPAPASMPVPAPTVPTTGAGPPGAPPPGQALPMGAAPYGAPAVPAAPAAPAVKQEGGAVQQAGPVRAPTPPGGAPPAGLPTSNGTGSLAPGSS